MRLLWLKAENFRNLACAELTPGRELTVLCGDNGQGKTNLLEAIWLLTGGRSFRGGRDAELIRRGCPFAVVEAVTERADGTQNRVRITIGGPESEKPGRCARVNGADRGRAAALAGSFPAVVFDPGHLSLVKGSPDGRRRFLDAALCQLYPAYLAAYRRYARALTQKNALLRNYSLTENAAALLDVLNAELAARGEELQKRRRDYIALLAPFAVENYAQLSRGAETLEIAYAPGFSPGTLGALLRQHAGEEIRAGCALYGPHREDLTILLDGQSARLFASQGQQRSAVLSLKLAEAACIRAVTKEYPVMLLDDVLSELDAGRRAYLLTRMQEKQTFVTSCDDTAFLETDGALWQVCGGELTPKAPANPAASSGDTPPAIPAPPHGG